MAVSSSYGGDFKVSLEHKTFSILFLMKFTFPFGCFRFGFATRGFGRWMNHSQILDGLVMLLAHTSMILVY
jgi:hypothetical protein